MGIPSLARLARTRDANVRWPCCVILRAVEFYQTHGWRVHREFPHEKFGRAMFEMTKSNETLPVL